MATELTTSEKLDKLIEAIADNMGYLQARYLDEFEYEDFMGYAEAMLNFVGKYNENNPDAMVAFVKANRRPFGFNFVCDDCFFKFGVTSTKIYIKPLKLRLKIN